MSRIALTLVAISAGLAISGCLPTKTPARAESVSSAAVAGPAPAISTVTASAGDTPPTAPSAAPGNTSVDPLDQLKSQLNEIASERVESAPIDVPVPDVSDAPPPQDQHEDDVQELRIEVQDLRRDVARLQETVDAALAYLVGELGDENRRLKKDLATQAELDRGIDDAAAPPVPEIPAAIPAPAVDYGERGYLAVKEWGRTPDQAKELEGNVTSLRGMICAVRPGATDEELKTVGKRLRDECAGFDNINIEVFDDEAAARDYAERNVRSSAHFVMRITRHKASAQDVTVLVRDNGSREVVVE
ncbi:MAG: hypothetical protein HUU46_13145 [Candidatus Hydrogenedentes bacterium]|nr:hypothetical protein [Candidatus Hydrogenedentota bacterium]